MIGASGQRIFLLLCGLAALTVAGCADMELPSWVPFQGPASDKIAGRGDAGRANRGAAEALRDSPLRRAPRRSSRSPSSW